MEGTGENVFSTSSSSRNITEEQKSPNSKKRITKNLIVISFGFLLLFMAYGGLSMLQSTLNPKLGVFSQAIIYAAFLVFTLVLPKYTIKKLGCKRAMLISMSCYIPYVAANFYFNWFTMVPSAVLVGLGAAVLWSAQCTYFNESSVIYSDLCLKVQDYPKNNVLQKDGDTNKSVMSSRYEDIYQNPEKAEKLQTLNTRCLPVESDAEFNSNVFVTSNFNPEKNSIKYDDLKKFNDTNQCNLMNFQCTIDNKVQENNFIKLQQITNSKKNSKVISSVTARHFGLFGLIFRSSDIWGNLLSYYLLNENSILDNITGNDTCSCGASFCNVDSGCFANNLAEPKQEERNLITGVAVALSFCGIFLVLLFLDELGDRQPTKFSFALAMATCKFVKKKEALLLLPLSAYIGFQQGFYIGDFTKSYIACAWGVYHVGLVTACYGLFGGVFSSLAGVMVKFVGRIPVLLGGVLMNISVNIYLLMWNPHSDQPLNFFISAAVLGAAIGILWSQLRALYGVIFKRDEEAAFAGFYLFDSIGYCTAFSYSNYICTNIKIYILLFVATIGAIGYLKTESLNMHQNKGLEPVKEST